MDINFANEIALVTGGPIDDTLNGYFAKAISLNLNNYINSLSGDLTTEANAFYDLQSKSKNYSFNFETLSPDSNYTISTNLSMDPHYESKGVTYYVNGNVNKNIAEKNGFLQNKHKKVAGHSPNFDPSNGAFQIFISNHIVSSVLSDFSSSMNFIFNVTNSNLNAKTFALNISSLEIIIPGI